MNKKIKSYGERYAFTKVKYKVNKKILIYIFFVFFVVVEIVLGVLWGLGY